jgi:hypothetical protein
VKAKAMASFQGNGAASLTPAAEEGLRRTLRM